MSSDNHDDTIADLVAKCLVLLEEGAAEIPYDEVCAEHPELKDAVIASVETAGALPGLHAQGPGQDRLIQSLIAERYRVKARIGAGAMGVVYAATDLDLGRQVAIKIMHTGLLERSTAMARFEREAEALAAVRHDAIVTIYDRGITEDGSSFLVMEHIEGVPCSEILEQAKKLAKDDDASWLKKVCGVNVIAEPSFLRQVIRWTADVASGLQAAHDAGVFHRDVKPSNIIVRPDGSAVLLDFGIAAKEDQATLTRTDAAVGTPAYMAPESLLGKAKPRPMLDVYGLSATLYHFLTLEPPYTGNASEILTAVATREPVPAVKVRPGLPRDAQAILDHGLMRNPASRYPSVDVMERDLRALLAFKPVSVRPTSNFVRAARRVRRSKLVIGAVLASLLIFGVLGVLDAKSSRAHAATIEAAEREASKLAAGKLAWPGIPPSFGFLDPENRLIKDTQVKEQIDEALGRLVASGHEPVVAHALRAGHRIDHGEVNGAQSDMREVAEAAGTPYARALSRLYDSLPIDTFGIDGLDLSALPNPEASADVYLAAIHAFRVGQPGVAMKLFLDPRLDESRHVKEIRFLFRAGPLAGMQSYDRKKERDVVADAIVDDARRLIDKSSFPGNTALHAMSAARLRQFRWAEALKHCERVLASSPDYVPPLQNAAEALVNMGDLDEANRYVNRALALAPKSLKVQVVLVRIETLRGRFDRALELLDGMEFAPSKLGQRQRALHYAQVLGSKAFLTRGSEPAAAKDAALKTLEYCSALKPSLDGRKFYEAVANGVLRQDDRFMFRAVLAQLVEQPKSIHHIDMLAQLVPAQLNEAERESLATWVTRLGAALEARVETANRPMTDNAK